MTAICLKDVDKAVCLAFATTPENLRGRRRAQLYVRPRFAFYDLARAHTRASLPAIGTYLHRDHTTVLHGLCRSAQEAESNSDYREKLDQARTILQTSTPFRLQIARVLAPEIAGDLLASG